MKKYQQFRFRPGIPGIDYDMFECSIGGPPSALKEALSEIAEALGLLELGDAQQAANTLGRILQRNGLPGDCDHPEIRPGGFQGCKGVRFAVELYGFRRRRLEEEQAKEKKREARRLRALKGGKETSA